MANVLLRTGMKISFLTKDSEALKTGSVLVSTGIGSNNTAVLMLENCELRVFSIHDVKVVEVLN